MPTKQARISVSNEGQSETVIINRLSDKLEDAIAVMMTAMVQLIQQQSSEKTIDNWDVERIVEAKLTQALERMSGYNATDAAKRSGSDTTHRPTRLSCRRGTGEGGGECTPQRARRMQS